LLALGFVLSASCSAASADSWQALVTGDALFGGSGAGGAGFDFGSSLATGFVGVSSGPAGDVAVSPDGQTGFVMFSGGVQEVDMATSPISAGPVISLTDGANGGVVSPNGDTLYVTDYADGLVIPIDLTQTPAAVDTSDEVSVGTDPYDVAISPDGDTLYVANQGSGNVSVVDLETSPLTVTHTITVGSWPMGMALSPNGSKL